MDKKIVVRNAYRRAFRKEFVNDDYGMTDQDIDDSVYVPEDDLGEWSPESLTIINFECGLPCPSYSDFDYSAINDEVEKMTGIKGIFLEPINGAVGAVWS